MAPQVFRVRGYSFRSALTGSTRDARTAGTLTAQRPTTSISETTPARVAGSIALTPTTLLRMSCIAAKAAGMPAANPMAIRTTAPADHHPDHCEPARAERHPNADFIRPPRDRVRRHAVEACNGEGQGTGGDGEQPRESGERTFATQRLTHEVAHGFDAYHSGRGTESLELTADRRKSPNALRCVF